jgi:DNA-dependent RNA polymerase auxiliary subunit epsilon
MPAEIILQPGPNAAGLAEKRERLAAVRAALAEREADIAQIRAQLKAFEGRYLQRVGVLYAELDEIAARITEREVDLYDSDSARRRAREARQRAQETHEAAFGADQEPVEFDPSPSLKTLFREVARRIHPDFASDEAEQKHFTLLMTRANHAYSCGDAETLQRLLDDHLDVNAAVADEGDGVTLLRLARQIQHAVRDIARLDGEQQTLLQSEIGQLYTDAEAAAHEDRDLLAELAASVRERIADAQYRLEFVERQVSALGR